MPKKLIFCIFEAEAVKSCKNKNSIYYKTKIPFIICIIAFKAQFAFFLLVHYFFCFEGDFLKRYVNICSSTKICRQRAGYSLQNRNGPETHCSFVNFNFHLLHSKRMTSF